MYISSIKYPKYDKNFSGTISSLENKYKGCFIGGAVGDALGLPVEGKTFQDIQKKYGQNGVIDFVPFKQAKKGTISDDTHMSLYTADGLIKTLRKNFDLDKIPSVTEIWKSYKDWRISQNLKNKKRGLQFHHGWISDIKNLNYARGAGRGSLNGMASDKIGTIEHPNTMSKGNGAIMRVAPVGLIFSKRPDIAFDVGTQIGAFTHGNSEGYLPSGCMASMIANIVQGNSIKQSIDNTVSILKKYKNHEVTELYIQKAVEMVNTNQPPENLIKILGRGRYGHETLAQAIYCAMKHPDDFSKAVLMAVNYTKDNDSVGAVVGNIMGAKLGFDNIPSKWADKVEFSKELQQVAKDIYNLPDKIENANERYPV